MIIRGDLMIQMRRKDKEMPMEAAVKILETNNYGTLAFMGEDGYPQSLPVNYVYIDGKIVIHGAKSGHKARVFENPCKVSFTVVSSNKLKLEDFNTYFESVMAFGIIKTLEGKEKDEIHYAWINKLAAKALDKKLIDDYYNSALAHTNVYAIELNYISGKTTNKNKK